MDFCVGGDYSYSVIKKQIKMARAVFENGLWKSEKTVREFLDLRKRVLLCLLR